MRLQLIRHATVVLNLDGLNILVDPMLGRKGEMPPFPKLTDFRRNPTAGLPITEQELEKLLESIDFVVLTHTHSDHFDDAATKLLRKNIPVICQPEDASKFKDHGFTEVYPVRESLFWNGIRIIRTSGHHGRGKIEKLLGKVSGFVLQAREEPVVYIAGDTVWCEEVDESIRSYKPDITIVNAGAARLFLGGTITMDAKDILKLCSKYDETQVVAVHMESVNHCGLSRQGLLKALRKVGLQTQVVIPKDGEILELARIRPSVKGV